MTLRLADNHLSDLILLGGGAAVTLSSWALTKCSPLLFVSIVKAISANDTGVLLVSDSGSRECRL